MTDRYTPALPIEAGCMALILDAPGFPEASGKIVKVLRRHHSCVDEWIHDFPPPRGYADVSTPEKCLLRIDDPGDETEELILVSQPWTAGITNAMS